MRGGGIGLIWRWRSTLLTAWLGALTLGSYLLVYTPLKRVTTLNTAIGAIPGALPPLMGWTAARGEVTGEGWSLFAILFFWQLPHFLAIAWIYREDYARAGFVMLPVVDPTGARTGRQALEPHPGVVAGQFVSLFVRAGRAGLFGGGAGAGGWLSVVRLSIFAAGQRGRGAAACFTPPSSICRYYLR